MEYSTGEIETLAANVIAENILSQVDKEGHRQMMLNEIIDHRAFKGTTIPKNEGTYKSNSGQERKKRTTRGWEICVEWKDGSSDWIAHKNLKGFIFS